MLERNGMTKAIAILSLSLIFAITACSERGKATLDDSKVTGAKKNYHGETTEKGTTTPLADDLKGKKLNLFLGKTVGEVLESYKYAEKKEWLEAQAKSGEYYIDYIFSLNTKLLTPTAQNDGVVQRWVDIKFAIRDNGEAYVALITIIDTKADGKTITTHYQSDESMLKIVKAIYDNKEIAL